MTAGSQNSQTDSPPVSASAERDQRTVELLTEAADGDPVDRQAAFSEAVELNLGLARYLASKYRRRGISDDDLEQVACLGLLKAVRGFSPERANSFAAYAIPTIRGELRRHFRDAGWTVRPPRRIQELRAHIRDTEAELAQRLHRVPTVAEIAESLDVEIEDVLEATAADSCFSPDSLDAPVRGASSDVAHDAGFDDPEFARTEARLVLEPVLGDLAERDRWILDLRFSQGLTQQQIGELVGVSQMQVSRILARVLGELRASILGRAA